MLLCVDIGQELPFNRPLPKSMYNKKALTHKCKQSHATGKPARELKGIWHTANTVCPESDLLPLTLSTEEQDKQYSTAASR